MPLCHGPEPDLRQAGGADIARMIVRNQYALSITPCDGRCSSLFPAIIKKPLQTEQLFLNLPLRLGRSANGANARASTAGNAGVSVDHKLAGAFADGGNVTFLGAGAAGHTFVTDRICHDEYLHVLMMPPLYTTSRKSASG